VFVVASVYFVMDSVRKLLNTPSYSNTVHLFAKCLLSFPHRSV